MNGLDETLRMAVVAERLTRRFHATRHGGVGHGTAVPDLLDDLVFRNEAGVVLDQQREDRKDLRFEPAGFALRPQLYRGQVQFKGTELVDHVCIE